MRVSLDSTQTPVHKTSILARLIAVLPLIAVTVCVSAATKKEQERPYVFEMPSQKVEEALNQVAQKTGHQLLFSVELVESLTAPTLVGEYSVQQALDRLLEGSNLSGRVTERGVIVLVAVDAKAPNSEAETAEMNTYNKGIFAVIMGLFSAPTMAVGQAAQEEDVAQDPASEVRSIIEEVIVTSQRREQNLQDVSVSVVVVTGDDLRARNENEISSLEKFDPSFRFAEGSQDAGRTIRIRGVGTQTFSRGAEQSIAVFVDGVVASNLPAALVDLNDVARIEVLHGPQGMLFGKNASAGLLNIVTANPTEATEYGFGVSYGDENEIKIDGYASGSLIENTLTGRISFYSNTRDGHIKNVFPGGKNHNDRDDAGYRAKLLWTPNDNFDALLTVAHSERDHHCCVTTAVAVTPGTVADLQGTPFGTFNDKMNSEAITRGTTDLDTFILNVNYQLSGGNTFSSITGYQDAESVDNVNAFNLGSVPYLVPNLGVDRAKQWTQEFQLASPAGEQFEYILGFYYFEKEIERQFRQNVDFNFFRGRAPGEIGRSTLMDLTTDFSSAAVFGNLTWNLSDRARLSVGARWQTDETGTEHLISSDPTAFQTVLLPNVGYVKLSDDDTATSWRLVGEYDWTETVMAYASVVRGYKGQVVNNLPTITIDADPILDPEIPTSYEAGIKSELWGSRVRLNGSLFHTRFEDFQAAATDVNVVPAQFFLANAGELTTEGVEVSIDARINNAFRATGSATYQRAVYDSYPGAACYLGQTAAQGCVGRFQDLSGTDLTGANRWVYALTGHYTKPLNTIPYSLSVLGSWVWRDATRGANNDPNPLAGIDSYGVADLFIGLDSNDNKYSFKIFAKNLFDEFYVVNRRRISTGGVTADQQLAYEYTRRIGVSARVNF